MLTSRSQKQENKPLQKTKKCSLQEPTFAPKINAISEDLDNRMRILGKNNMQNASTHHHLNTIYEEGGGANTIRRCDTLYELAMNKMRDLEVKRQMREEEKLKDELQEVTFRP